MEQAQKAPESQSQVRNQQRQSHGEGSQWAPWAGMELLYEGVLKRGWFIGFIWHFCLYLYVLFSIWLYIKHKANDMNNWLWQIIGVYYNFWCLANV